MNTSNHLTQQVFNYQKELRRLLWVGFSALILIMLCYVYVDRPLTQYLANLHMADRFPSLLWLTDLGNSTMYFMAFLMLAIFFHYFYPRGVGEQRFWFLCLCLVLSTLATGILKVFFGRARPDLWFSLHEYGFDWLKLDRPHMSFPSGHTTTMMSLALGLSVLFPRYWLGFLSLGVLVAMSRVVLLEHYLSDVVAAMALTFLVVSSLAIFLREKSYLSKIWQKK